MASCVRPNATLPAEAIAIYDDMLAHFGTATELLLREWVALAKSRRRDLQTVENVRVMGRVTIIPPASSDPDSESTAIGTSPWPVMTITGNLIPSWIRRRCSSSPFNPGICTSVRTQPTLRVDTASRNSVADA